MGYRFDIQEHDVGPNGGTPLRVAFLSDIHRSDWVSKAETEAAAQACRARHPDVLLLGGDYISGEKDLPLLEELADTMATVAPPLGIYYVLGNHDYWSGAAEVRAAFDRVGMHDMTNRNTCLDGGLHLCGIDDAWAGRPDVEAAFRGSGERRLVLMHNPKTFDKISDRGCTAIAGHTHGGQVRIPFLPNPASLHDHRYIAGWFSAGNSRLYVSKGLGKSIVPFRINCPPEITFLNVKI